MKQISVMLKPASGMCNMCCTYCFYADVASHRETPNYGMMSLDTAHRIIDNVFDGLESDGQATFAFQGGEPTLAGIAFFQDFFEYATENREGIHVDFVLQTNGFLIDENWCRLLKKYNVLVGLSVDGYKQLHDGFRKDMQGGGTFNRIMDTKKCLEQNKVAYNILTVLTSQVARHPEKIWNFILKEKIEFIQFIPCLDDLGAMERSEYALTPERFYRFYRSLFPLWVSRLRQGEYISIKLFDDLVNYYVRGLPTACGINGSCNKQFVCEGDGSVFPCDFYMLDAHRIGFLAEEPLDVLCTKKCDFLEEKRKYRNQLPCSKCKYLKSCGGGCKRMQKNMYIEGEDCWYAKLLDEILKPLLWVGKILLMDR